MTALGSVPKAHKHGDPDGTWNLEKLHLELKYLGRKLADAKLQRRRHSQGFGFSSRKPPPAPIWTEHRPGLLVPFGVLCSKDVNCAVVAGHADERRVLIEIDAEKHKNQIKASLLKTHSDKMVLLVFLTCFSTETIPQKTTALKRKMT